MKISNSIKSPQFTALKINIPQEKLEKFDIEELEKLENAGKELANTKKWDLEVSDDKYFDYYTRYKIVNRNTGKTYMDEIKAKPSKLGLNDIQIEGNLYVGQYVGESFSETLHFINRKAADNAYETLNNTEGLDNAVEATKILEECSKPIKIQEPKTKEEIYQEKRQEAKNKAIKLLKKYGPKEA